MSFARPLPVPRASEPAVVLCLAAFLAPAGVTAQPHEDGLPPPRPALERLIESVEPRAGPVGTRVHVSSVEMPMITPIWVGIGASRIGFEAFHTLMTDLDGTFAVEIDVPVWAQWDRAHTFIAFDLYFRPIALSEVFHVTDENGRVRRGGQVRGAAAGAGCVGLEDEEGHQYALDGLDSGDFRPGDEVTVEGRIVFDGRCGVPQTIIVSDIERAGSP